MNDGLNLPSNCTLARARYIKLYSESEPFTAGTVYLEGEHLARLSAEFASDLALGTAAIVTAVIDLVYDEITSSIVPRCVRPERSVQLRARVVEVT